jgi:hypothetical protein
MDATKDINLSHLNLLRLEHYQDTVKTKYLKCKSNNIQMQIWETYILP